MSFILRMIGWFLAINFTLAALLTAFDSRALPAAALLMIGLATTVLPRWRVSAGRRIASFFIMFFVLAVVLGIENKASDTGLSLTALAIAFTFIVVTFFYDRIKLISWRNRLTEPEMNHLIGLCEGILADDKVVQREAETLRKLFQGDNRYSQNFRCRPVVDAVNQALADDSLSADEAAELRTVLSEFCDIVLRDVRPIQKQKKTRPVAKKKERANVTPPVAGDVFDITYTDAKGDISDREIKFRSCSRKGGSLYINAICSTRNAYRTFRADRISSATHTGTGEWIDSPALYFGAA